MTLRARTAVMVILFLVGCVFAAPFYRTVSSSSNSSSASPPTLQIQRPAVMTLPEVPRDTDVTANAPQLNTQFPGQAAARFAEPKAENRSSVLSSGASASGTSNTLSSGPPSSSVLSFSGRPDQQQQQPFPGLKMPTPLTADASATFSAGANRTSVLSKKPDKRIGIGVPGRGSVQPRLKPVSLIGTDIGTDINSRSSWNSNPGSAVPRSNRQSNLPRIDGRGNTQSPNTRRIDRYDKPQASARLSSVGERPANQWPTNQRLTNERPNLQSAHQSAPINRNTRMHRIMNGDTLQGLSIEYFGRPDLALMIFEANRNTLASPDILPLGKELVIPDKTQVRSPPRANFPSPQTGAAVGREPPGNAAISTEWKNDQPLPASAFRETETNDGWRSANLGHGDRLSG